MVTSFRCVFIVSYPGGNVPTFYAHFVGVGDNPMGELYQSKPAKSIKNVSLFRNKKQENE